MNGWLGYCIRRIKSLKAIYIFAWEALTWQVLGRSNEEERGMRHIERLVNTVFMLIAPLIFIAAVVATAFYIPILGISAAIGGMLELIDLFKKPQAAKPKLKQRTSTAKIAEVMVDMSPEMPALVPLRRPDTPMPLPAAILFSRSSDDELTPSEGYDSFNSEEEEEMIEDPESSWWPHW